MTDHAHADALRCTGVTVGHAQVDVLRELDLALERGRVMAVLGPSGAGKTTLLHTVAGFDRPTSGEIWLSDVLVAGGGVFVPPERRRVGLVFQDNALWPHLDVLATVAYPLRRQGKTRGDAERQAHHLLEQLGVEALARRRPHQLSGGEQQRVGLARALARDARLFLFDEPTSHLDLPLRKVAQGLIQAGREEGLAAALYTTHEAGEALALADDVAVLVGGRLAQVGTPLEVYDRPRDETVAQLTGAASVLEVTVDKGLLAVIDGKATRVAGLAGPGMRRLLVRPGWASMDGPLRGTVVSAAFQGPHSDHELETSAGRVVIRRAGPPVAAPGDEVGWTLERGWLLGG
ncbi:MAG: ABC transporter ATP-binding protein [Candidatus Dormibacteria bacterium]